MTHTTTLAEATTPILPPHQLRRRHGAIGKAIIVWLVTGSALAGLGAYLLFGAMGC